MAYSFLDIARTPSVIAAQSENGSAELYGRPAIAALGIAPAFNAYRFPRPIYLTLWDGDSVGWGAAIVSFLLTWLLVWLQVRMLAHRRRAASA